MTASVITALLFMIAALTVRGVFGRRISGKMLMAIWAAVFIRLAVPVYIPSDFSVMNLFPEDNKAEAANDILTKTAPETAQSHHSETTEKRERSGYVPPVTDGVPDRIAAGVGQPSPEITDKKPDIVEAARTVYIAVTAALELAAVCAYIICAVRFSRLESMTVPERFGGKNIRYKKSSMGTPAVFGIFRPVILIPESTDISDSVILEHIILHEKTHIRHRDPFWNFITLIICCANWYDPLVWVCRALYLRDAEKWCDESVIARIGTENKRSYAQSLLACAENRSRPLMLISGFGESDIKGRIKAMMNDKKFRRGASVTALLLMAASLAAFGTGKAVKAEMEDIGFVPYEKGRCYTQRFVGNNGESADVNLILSHDYKGSELGNYYHFILDTDSADYTAEDAHAVIRAEGVSSYRILYDGIKTEEDTFTYSADLNKDTNDIELMIFFDDYSTSRLNVTVTYKLKKDRFTVGTYTVSTQFSPAPPFSAPSYANSIETINNNFLHSGFTVSINNDRYEITSVDDSADFFIYFNENSEAYVSRISDGKELEIFLDPYRTDIKTLDITGDGTDDIIMTAYISGTGIIENQVDIIDGEKLSFIPIDGRSAGQMIKDYVCSEEFARREGGNIFLYEHDHGLSASNKLFPYSFDDDHEYLDAPLLGEGNTDIYGGLSVWAEYNKIKGSAVYVLSHDERHSDMFGASFDFVYEDGILKPVNMQTGKYTESGYEESISADDIPHICTDYIYSLWSYFFKLGEFEPEKYISDDEMLTYANTLKAQYEDVEGHGLDGFTVEPYNALTGHTADGRIWTAFTYDLTIIPDSDTLSKEPAADLEKYYKGYMVYFELDGTDGEEKIYRAFDIIDLPVDRNAVKYPIEIDMAAAVDALEPYKMNNDGLNIIS